MSMQIVLNFVIFCCFVSAHLAQNDPPCGVKGPSQSSSGNLGIIGGDDAGPFEFPWQVVLYKDDDLICGASILNSRWVITAGVCMSKFVGKQQNWNELQNLKEFENVVESLSFSDIRSTDHWGFDKIIFHPHFSIGAYNIPVNDIALVKVKEALPLSDPSQHMAAICLPKEYSSGHYLEGTVCTITGYGMINQNGEMSQTLKRANVTISKHRSCMKTYADVATVDKTMICTYDEGKSFCHGDAGGPMICYDEGKWNLIGIMSWQYGCAEPNYPEVYTRVVEFVQWINETIANN